jgi:AraC-like DNA-binding protein
MIDGYDSGADAYVAKPFEIKVLLTQISRLIKNRELIRSKYRQQNFMIDIMPDPSSKDDRFLQRLNEEINKNISDHEFNVSKLSEILDLSPTQIYRKIKALTGCSSVEYIRIIKLNRAVALLKTNKYSVKEVCYKSGFNDPSYFVRCFKEHFKATPSEFKYLKLPSSN